MTLQLDGLTVTRGGFHLRPISLELGPGVTALVGRNGAGKTTLMAAVLGLLRARGSAKVEGHATRGGSRPAAMAALGYLPQRPHLPGMLTVSQAVAYAAWLKRVGDGSSAVTRALHRVDLDQLRDRRIGRLSGGQVQRVCIAQAVVHQPSVLLLDEPTVSLDPQQRAFLYALIGGLAADGATVLTSTHNLDDVTATAHRMLVLDGGRLVADEALAVDDSAKRYALVKHVVASTLVDRR